MGFEFLKCDVTIRAGVDFFEDFFRLGWILLCLGAFLEFFQGDIPISIHIELNEDFLGIRAPLLAGTFWPCGFVLGKSKRCGQNHRTERVLSEFSW